MTRVPLSMISGLGSAAVLDAGSGGGEVPTNDDLGSAAYLDAGAGALDIPVNGDLTELLATASGYVTNNGSVALGSAVNIDGVVRTATGTVEVSFTDPMANADYRVLINQDGGAGYTAVFSRSVNGFIFETRGTGSGYPLTDRDVSFVVFGEKA